MSLKRKSMHSMTGDTDSSRESLQKDTKKVDMRGSKGRGLDIVPSMSMHSPPMSSSRAPTSRLKGVEEQESDDDDSLNVQAMLEHLKQVSQKKSSKNRAKLELLVDNAFRQIEETLNFALREEERKSNTAAELIQTESKRMQQSLVAWAKEVHQTNESYNTAMRNLATQFEKLTSGFSRTMQSLTQECTASARIEERHKRLHRECQQLLQTIKNELATKPESSGLEGKAIPLLLKAFMS